MSISINSSRMTPPSRMGMGSRLKMARLRLTVAIRLMKAGVPSRAASPESWAMRMGPSSERAEERRSTIDWRNW